VSGAYDAAMSPSSPPRSSPNPLPTPKHTSASEIWSRLKSEYWSHRGPKPEKALHGTSPARARKSRLAGG
jgi:hypothetical protein